MKKIILLWMLVFLVLINLHFVFAQSTGVCCLDAKGYCSSNKDAGVCKNEGGKIVGGALCYNSDDLSSFQDCSLVSCIFSSGKCTFTTRARCVALEGKVDTSKNEQQCNSLQEDVFSNGCCISSGSCSMTLRNQCTGQFESGKNCEDVTECSGQCGKTREACSSDGTRILNVNDCGVINVKEQLSGEERCVDDGIVKKKTTSCEVGGTTRVLSMNIGTSKPLIKEEQITPEMLGKVSERKSGESWCIIYGTSDGKNWNLYSKSELKNDNLRQGFSAGQRHAVYNCIDGNIVVEQGDLFRAKKGICMQNNEAEFYLIGTEDEKWATCEGGVIQTIQRLTESSYTISRSRSFLDVARNYFKRGLSKAVLIDNYEFTNDCKKPRYSEGSEFYGDKSAREISPASECNVCGKGFWNRCDKSECYRSGDCSYEGRGVTGFAKGCAIGAVIAETLYLTAGSAGLHSGGGWGSIFSASAPVVTGAETASAQLVATQAEYAAYLAEASTGASTSGALGTAGAGLGGAIPAGAKLPAQGISTWQKIQTVTSAAGTANYIRESFSGIIPSTRKVRKEGDPSDQYDEDTITEEIAGSVDFKGARVDSQGNTRAYLSDPNSKNPRYIIAELNGGGVDPLIVKKSGD